MQAKTVTIVGMNRIGASVAMALKASPVALNIVGNDRRRDRTEQAKADVAALDSVEWNLATAVAQADILVLAIPLTELRETLAVIGDEVQPHTLILDLSTLKGPGIKFSEQYLGRGHYVGATPILSARVLADGRDTLDAASTDLFRSSIFCIMPSAAADPQAVDTAVRFGSLLGAVPYFVDPFEYDALAQGIETLPALLAAALFGAVQQSPAWRDMLRFANTSFGVATQPLDQGTDIVPMILTDKAATLRWLDAIDGEIKKWRSLIEQGDVDLVELTLAELLLKRSKWLKERADNEWTEDTSPKIESPDITEQLLGGWITRNRKKGDDR
jgi:prephenate dehydrogenase